ncbi:MAG: hypothetical protein ACREFF_11915 [Candidatus Udaeobacter sp.]
MTVQSQHRSTQGAIAQVARFHFAGVDHGGGPRSPQDESVRLADLTGSGIELSTAISSLINALFLRGLN